MKNIKMISFEHELLILDTKLHINLVLDLLIKYNIMLDVTKRDSDFTVSGKTSELYKLIHHLSEQARITLM